MDKDKKAEPIDLLRRVFVPIEKRNIDGTYSFRTQDKREYVRMQDGSIRRAGVKRKGGEGG
jgi:hypothetical protein